MKLVMKFGGTSLQSSERINIVRKIILEHVKEKKDDEVVVVVSALGDMTDVLLELSKVAASGGDITNLTRKTKEVHNEALKAISSDEIRSEASTRIEKEISELEKLCLGIRLLGELTPRVQDTILSFGERLSAIILTDCLSSSGLKVKMFTGAEAGIITDSNYGEARPLMDATKHQISRNLSPILESGTIAVVTGFIAADQDGHTTTLGRGGSDYTATIVAASIGADEVWIFTDVDGLMTADPRICKKARLLKHVSFQEAVEMVGLGARGMHPRSLEPILGSTIPLVVRNTFNLSTYGTTLTSKIEKSPEVIKTISLVSKVSMLTVSGVSMVGAPGTASKIFEILGRNLINIIMISQSLSESNISMIVSRSVADRSKSLLEGAFLGSIASDVECDRNVAVIAVVGAGMKGTPGIASKVFNVAARAGVNVKMIAQGSSELNLSFVINEQDSELIVNELHKEFFEH
jgi:aspartate kinase